MAEAILDFLKDIGAVSSKLREQISQQNNLEILRNWHKLSARVKTIEEFEANFHALVSSARDSTIG